MTETISDLNRSLRARYFVSVLDETTSFASRARAFESTRLLNCFECELTTDEIQEITDKAVPDSKQQKKAESSG